MLYKEFLLNKNNIEELGRKINNFFINYGHYVVIKNYNVLTDDEIVSLYEKINNIIGKVKPIDLNENYYTPTMNNWANVKYEFGSDEKQFWRSSNHQNIHTDNTFASTLFYANLTELVCLKPVEYSGNTTLISNDKLIELIHYVDNNNNTNFFDKIYNNHIYFSINANQQIKKPILSFNSEKNKYTFNFNYYPAIRAKNTDSNKQLIDQFHLFLEEKIMNSSNIMDEIKLNRGDAIIFNDELVLHGRRSFIGTRHYIKSGIHIPEIILVNTDNFIVENKY